MRKFGSIFFVLILVFNFWGYRWVLSYMETNATVRLQAQLDAGKYDPNQLVEVKIPLNLPYYTNYRDYEPYSGEMKWNGENYQYVKRKVAADTLYLLCIPHTEKNNIQSARVDFFKIINNLQNDGTAQKNGQQPPSIKLMLSEFLENDDQFSCAKFNSPLISFNSYQDKLSSIFDPLTPAQPPEC